ncbi:thioesterase II family protein [Laceyella putida]|uniref:Thioesterase II family protein n=1 Tax=Laceyella putida TaxID=110101 RepID=A0ABW2RFT6_9BACL
MSTKTNQVLMYRKPNPQAELRLFCFPYAGGGASIYTNWQTRFSKRVEVCPVQLPGRENRMLETPISSMAQLVPQLADELEGYLDQPFLFFGHSMGALISFELTRELRRRNQPLPQKLIVSAKSAPHVPRRKSFGYASSDVELIAELRELNGTPEEVLQSEELMELFLPIIRADFELVTRYAYQEEEPLSCPILALGGTEDADVPPENLAAWQQVTTGDFSLRLFAGDHFYLFQENTDALDKIIETVEE